MGRLRAPRLQPRRQGPRLRRLPAGTPAHGQRHHPRRPAASPAGWSMTSTRARSPRRSTRPSQGVDYTLPFGLIASIVPPGHEERGAPARQGDPCRVARSWRLERTGDLGAGECRHAGSSSPAVSAPSTSRGPRSSRLTLDRLRRRCIRRQRCWQSSGADALRYAKISTHFKGAQMNAKASVCCC